MNLKLRKLEHRMARQKQMRRCMLLLLTLLPACSVAGMRFNPAFLSGDTEAVADLSRFEKGMTYLPGSYEVEIWVNDSPLTSLKVTFKADEQNQLIPCFSLDELVTLGINYYFVSKCLIIKPNHSSQRKKDTHQSVPFYSSYLSLTTDKLNAIHPFSPAFY